MKKILLIGIAFGIASLAQATDITISTPSSLNGYYAYTLGVNLNVPTDQQISSVTISFDNVQLASAPKGYLYVDLLNLNNSGVKSFWDGDRSGDYFASQVNSGQGTAVGTAEFSQWNQTLNLTFTLNADELAALNNYAADGIFDIGIDPDCYFYIPPSSCTVHYTCNHQTVPDTSMTAELLGMSLLGLVLFRRKLAFN